MDAPLFSSLRALTVAPLGFAPPLRDYSNPSPLAGLRHFTYLTALDLDQRVFSFYPLHPSSLQPLLHLRALRTLRMTGHMSAEQFALVLSLPVTCLDLHSAHVAIHVASCDPFPSLPPLRTLLMPSMGDQHLSRPSVACHWERAILMPLATATGQQGKAVELERLLMGLVAPSNLRFIPLFRRLHTLQLDLLVTKEALGDLSDFHTALVSYSLPLRHLHLAYGTPWKNKADAEWLALFYSLLSPVILAYAEQLRTLELTVVFKGFVLDQEQRLHTAEMVTAALLCCHSLRRLRVSDWWLCNAAPAQAVPAFPYLEALSVDAAVGVDEVTLAVILDSAPHLQELTVSSWPLSWDVLPWLIRCPELRTLMMTEWEGKKTESEGKWEWEGKPCLASFALPDIDRWRRPPSSPALPRLTTLILQPALDKICPQTGDFDLRVEFLEAVVAYLAQAVPALRYLHLPVDEWLDEYRAPLVQLGGLTSLKGFSMGQRWMYQGHTTEYWRWPGQYDGRVQRRLDAMATSLWGEEVLPRSRGPWKERRKEKMRAGPMHEEEVSMLEGMDGLLVPTFQEDADGTTAAAAFFAAIQ